MARSDYAKVGKVCVRKAQAALWFLLLLSFAIFVVPGVNIIEDHGNQGLRRLACFLWRLEPSQPHVLDRWCVGWVSGILGCMLLAFGNFTFWGSSCYTTWQFPRGSCATISKICSRNIRLCTALSLMAFLHQGEALNPGPSTATKDRQWSIGTFNPSGLGGKQQVINSYLSDSDLWAVTETHLSSRSMQSFRAGLKRSQSPFQYCVGGSPVSLRQHSDQVGSWSGVAMLSKHPTRQVPVKWQPHSYETSRVLITSTLCHNLWVSGGVVYGEPPGIKHPDAMSNTDMLLKETLDHLMTIGGLRFLAGDFNFEKDTLEAFHSLTKAGFRDIQDIAEEKWGRKVQLTCKHRTRKDFCFISPELQSLMIGVEVDHTIWADHAAVKGLFRGGSSVTVQHHWRMPHEFEWPHDLQFEAPQSWWRCNDPSRQYEELWAGAEKAANQARISHGKLPLQSSCFGRAATHEVTLRHSLFKSGPLRSGRSGDIQPQFAGISQKHAHWFRQLRRLQSYTRFRRIHASDTDHIHGTSLWSSILRGKGFSGGFCEWWTKEGSQVFGSPQTIPLIPPCHEIAAKIYESFQLDVRKLENELRGKQRKHAVSRRAELAHLVFKDIQRQSPDRIDLLLKSNSGIVKEIHSNDAILVVDMERPLDPTQPIYVAGVQVDVIHVHHNEVCLTDASAIREGDPVRQTSFLGQAEDLFRAFETEWKARWDRHKTVPPSQWVQICDFGRRVLQGGQCEYHPLNSQMLLAEVARKKPRSATGLDGVSLRDLKNAPAGVHKGLCFLYQQAETTGEWPLQMVNGKVASLAKVASPDSVQSFRPITILSQCYRLWSSIRAKHMLQFMHGICPAFLFGNRPHCKASQVWTHLAWALEESFLSGTPMGGVMADIEKAFNHLPREVIYQAAVTVGLPQKLLVGWAGAISVLVRRFQVRNHLSPPVGSTTGFPEGCALSCLAMMLMDCLFHKWFEHSFPLCQPVSYVDDLQLLTSSPSQIPQLMDHLLAFARLVDLKVDQRKTFVWSNDAYYRSQFRQAGLTVKKHARGLGAQLHFGRKHTTEVLRSRLLEMAPLWFQLRVSPSPYHLKTMAVKQVAWPRGLHGVAATSVSLQIFANLRSQVMKGLCAEGSGCNPMIHLGGIEHPTLDPQAWAIIETLRTVRESASEESLSVLISEAVAPDSQIPHFSMTQLLVERLHFLGWTCTHGVKVKDLFGEFSLLQVSFPELVLRICHAWGHVIADAVSHRKTFDGLHKADFAGTRAYVRGLDQTDQGIFRKALNGAHFTNDSVCHFSDTGTVCCEFCGEPDSRFHRFWKCKVFETARSECSQSFLDLVPQLPPSLTNHGWAILPETWRRWTIELLQLPLAPIQDSLQPTGDTDQWLDIFTDGSCLWPRSKTLRLSSWALVQAHSSGDPCKSQVVSAGVVPGMQQSAYRAELLAVRQSLLYAAHWGRRLRIWSDCQSVVNKFCRILARREQPKSKLTSC